VGSFSQFAFENKGILPSVWFGFKGGLTFFPDPLTMRPMKKFKDAPQISRQDDRTGDEFIRQWCEHIGSILAAERAAGLCYNHLHTWLNDPNRNFSPDNAVKVAHAANMPLEALFYRWTPIKDLDFWRWSKIRK